MATFQTEVDALLEAIFLAAVTKGSVELTGGASGSVDGILVDSVEIMSGAVGFVTDLSATAAAVAANINANTSVPNYTAVAVGAIVYIIADDGIAADTFTVVSSTTTITSTDTAVAAGTGNKSQDLASNKNASVRDRQFAKDFAVEFFRGIKDTTKYSGSTILEELSRTIDYHLREAKQAS